jgi:hypothetical protein
MRLSLAAVATARGATGSVFGALTWLGRAAAARFNEVGRMPGSDGGNHASDPAAWIAARRPWAGNRGIRPSGLFGWAQPGNGGRTQRRIALRPEIPDLPAGRDRHPASLAAALVRVSLNRGLAEVTAGTSS